MLLHIFFIFYFLLSTSSACKCIDKAGVPWHSSTKTACEAAGGKMSYWGWDDFDCPASSMSENLSQFAMICHLSRMCSDCRCSECGRSCTEMKAENEQSEEDSNSGEEHGLGNDTDNGK